MTVSDEKYTLDAVNVSYSKGGVTLLGDMSVQMVAGEVTAVLGPNGAGKSTLLSLLSGQRRSGGMGTVRLNGQPIQSCSPGALARMRAVLPQNTAVAFDFTVQEVVELGRFAHARNPSQNEGGIVQGAMQATRVAAFAQRNVNTLSGGEQARTHLARVLAQIWEPMPEPGARWLLLDEPTASLDIANQHEVLRLARAWAPASRSRSRSGARTGSGTGTPSRLSPR